MWSTVYRSVHHVQFHCCFWSTVYCYVLRVLFCCCFWSTLYCFVHRVQFHCCFWSTVYCSMHQYISHSLDLFTSSSPGVFQVYLWPLIAPGYLGRGLPCLSSALWYPCTVKLYECKCVVTKYPCRSCLSNGWECLWLDLPLDFSWIHYGESLKWHIYPV